MSKRNFFFTCATAVLTLFLITSVVYIVHLKEKVKKFSSPSLLFSAKRIEAENLSKVDVPDVMSRDLNKFCFILCQNTFTWQRKGQNVFIFSSKDDKYMLKFLPAKVRADNVKAFQAVLDSVQLSYDNLREETGLEFLHLNKTTKAVRGISLIDFYGNQLRVCGDFTRFVVQKKAKLLQPFFKELMDQGNIIEAKRRVDQIMELILSLARKKISDGEDDLILNDCLGFTEKRAIYLDTWHFFKVPDIDVKKRMQYEFKVRLKPFEKWLGRTYPELGQYYQEKKESIMSGI